MNSDVERTSLTAAASEELDVLAREILVASIVLDARTRALRLAPDVLRCGTGS